MKRNGFSTQVLLNLVEIVSGNVRLMRGSQYGENDGEMPCCRTPVSMNDNLNFRKSKINSRQTKGGSDRLLTSRMGAASEREDERGLPKGCSINLDFSEKGNQEVWWAHPSSRAGHISTRETFRIKGVRARPGLYVTFGSKLHSSLLLATLVVYIYMDRNKIDVAFWIDCRHLKIKFRSGASHCSFRRQTTSPEEQLRLICKDQENKTSAAAAALEKKINRIKIPQTLYGRRNIFFAVSFGLKGTSERLLHKSRLFEKGNQKSLVGSSIFQRRTYQHTRKFSHKKGVRARPGLCVTFGSKLQPLLLSAPLSLYIFIRKEIKWTSLFGLIAGILKSNFGQGPVIVHSGVNRRRQRKVEIDLQGSGGR
ncbi:hypothetical protein CEXT_333781 [Caerostris extrusa]|uniref:Ribosomal protein S3 n=1 Tax=Caerostris extrusa TaxID=172846 RepID=A0AAV4VAF4_CAEEX|nr:hypothetical protein CEXT_333781 [Caerostris extrusa]